MATKRVSVKLLGEAKEEYLKLQEIVRKEKEKNVSGSFHQTLLKSIDSKIVLLKANGVTGVMTYLSENTFSAETGQLLGKGPSNELRLSSIIDGIIILRYVERKQQVLKLMNILKMRGSKHDKRIWHFDVGKDGIQIGKAFS